jgi:hypothetical protein
MALPLTITGISTAVAPVGPFKSSGGAYYFFGRNGTTSSDLTAMKATDPTSSFSSAASVSFSGTIQGREALSAFVVGDVVHIAVWHAGGSPLNLSYVTFNMGTDSFSSIEAVQTGVSNGDGSGNGIVSIVVRSTGDVVIAYNGATESVMGTSYRRVRYARRVSSVWTTAIIVDPQGSVNWTSPECCIGLSDRTHIFYCDGTNTGQRTLNSANTLQTASTTVTIGTELGQSVSYDDAGTYRVIICGTSGVGRFNSADSPTISTVSVTNMGHPARLFIDG